MIAKASRPPMKAKAKAKRMMSPQEKAAKEADDLTAPTGKTYHGEGYVVDKSGESKYRAFRPEGCDSGKGKLDVDVKYTDKLKNIAYKIACDKIDNQVAKKSKKAAPS
jgi:hypothetical protein